MVVEKWIYNEEEKKKKKIDEKEKKEWLKKVVAQQKRKEYIKTEIEVDEALSSLKDLISADCRWADFW